MLISSSHTSYTLYKIYIFILDLFIENISGLIHLHEDGFYFEEYFFLVTIFLYITLFLENIFIRFIYFIMYAFLI